MSIIVNILIALCMVSYLVAAYFNLPYEYYSIGSLFAVAATYLMMRQRG